MQSNELLPLLPRVFFYLQRDRDPFFSGNARLSEGGVQSGDVELLYVPPVLLSAGKFAFSIFVVYIEGGGGGPPPVLFGSEAIVESCQLDGDALTCDTQVTMISHTQKKLFITILFFMNTSWRQEVSLVIFREWNYFYSSCWIEKIYCSRV